MIIPKVCIAWLMSKELNKEGEIGLFIIRNLH